MIIIDAQLSPYLAIWIKEFFQIEAYSVSFLGLKFASDFEIYQYARNNDMVVMTKDIDFVKLVEKYGSLPKILWITSGNTSNSRMKEILGKHLQQALLLLEMNNLIEISD